MLIVQTREWIETWDLKHTCSVFPGVLCIVLPTIRVRSRRCNFYLFRQSCECFLLPFREIRLLFASDDRKDGGRIGVFVCYVIPSVAQDQRSFTDFLCSHLKVVKAMTLRNPLFFQQFPHL